MESIINKNTIIQFYNYAKKSNLNELTLEKRTEIENAVAYWNTFFHNKTQGTLSLMTFTAEKMITSNGRYGVITPAEKLYFFIKMVDPAFYFLEVHEVANTKEQAKLLAFKNFGFYDPYLITYEKIINEKLQLFDDDIWALQRINR